MANNKSAAKSSKEELKPVSWAHAFRDIAVSSINRGQLPLFGFFLVLLALIWKMPEHEVSRLVFELLESLGRGEYLAYVTSVLLAAGWFTYARVQRRNFVAEFERVGKLKSELQDQVAGSAYSQRGRP